VLRSGPNFWKSAPHSPHLDISWHCWRWRLRLIGGSSYWGATPQQAGATHQGSSFLQRAPQCFCYTYFPLVLFNNFKFQQQNLHGGIFSFNYYKLWKFNFKSMFKESVDQLRNPVIG
jgi:hypothetical protein